MTRNIFHLQKCETRNLSIHSLTVADKNESEKILVLRVNFWTNGANFKNKINLHQKRNSPFICEIPETAQFHITRLHVEKIR